MKVTTWRNLADKINSELTEEQLDMEITVGKDGEIFTVKEFVAEADMLLEYDDYYISVKDDEPIITLQ